jgi:hypothetical protein
MVTGGDGSLLSCSDIELVYAKFDEAVCTQVEENGNTEYFARLCECPGIDICRLCAEFGSVSDPDKVYVFADGSTKSCAELETIYVNLGEDECYDVNLSGRTDTFAAFCGC